MHMMPRTLLALAFTCLLTTAHAAECPYAAKPVNWILRYCAMVVGTDDEIEIQKSACFKTAGKDINAADACAMKERYKTRICEEFMMESKKYRSVSACLGDGEVKEFISG